MNIGGINIGLWVFSIWVFSQCQKATGNLPIFVNIQGVWTEEPGNVLSKQDL